MMSATLIKKGATVRENSRWHLTDFQRLVVVLAVASAIFLSALALGSQSIIPLLVAMVLLIGAGLGVFLLGLRFTGRAEHVQGHAYVIMAQPPPVGKIVGRCDLRLLVDLPNQPSTMVKMRDPSVPVTKWPTVGMTLPVEVSPRNPRQLRVRWELVDDHTLRAARAIGSDSAAVPFFTEYSDTELQGLGGDAGVTTAGPTADHHGPDNLGPGHHGPDNLGPDNLGPDNHGHGDLGHGDPAQGDLGYDDLPRYDMLAITAEVPPPRTTEPADGYLPPEIARPDYFPADPDTILGDEIIIPPHLSADLSPESHARAAEFDLPVRSIPQPRPAEGLTERRVAAPAGGSAVTDQAADGQGMGMMLVVSDLNRSLRFYRDLVGLSVVDSGANVAVLAYGSARVLLRQLADMSPVDRRVAHLHISVSDVDASYKDLKDRGIEFVHRPRVTSRGDKLDLWAATFRDPDGHDIALTQWRAREDAPPPS